ncbi:hypothetical protein BaRGS_00031232 [Batillaria attramentaria]|uniref:Fibronectin type-III domain-containing protein n=1 Tax=Batillaria attramentaria TaxID=370345 RepID=A0ABD0JRI4_9CAEN
MSRWRWSSGVCFVVMAAVTMVTMPSAARDVGGCPSVCQCTEIYYVYCNGLGLTSDSLHEILLSVSPEAIFLDLSSNSIERLKPGVLNSVPNLEYLVLANNHIETIGVSVFHYLHQIKELNLTQNRLKEVSANVFVNMPNLEKLHLASNELSRIQERAFSLPHLQELHLQHNRLTAIRPLQLSGLPCLTYLDLSHNDIHTLEVGAFQELSALRTLRLSHNRLASLAENVFQGLTSLRHLYLDSNVLPSLDCFDVPSFASTLQVLVMSNNSLGSIPQDVFPKLQNLKTLAVDHNHISTISQRAFRDLQLDNLTLAHNDLEAIDRDMFESVRRISWFDLSHNKIHTIKTGAFDRFRESVYVLNLAGNRLDTVHRGMFRVMRNLLELNLSSNALWNIQNATFQELTSLSRLDLDDNQLRWLSADLLRGPTLDMLSVVNNPLTSLRGFTFNDTNGPVSVFVNLTLRAATEYSVTVTWPYEGTQLYWTVRVWCVSVQGTGSCFAGPREETLPPYRTSHSISDLRPGSRYYVCVLPKFLADSVLVSQCGLVSTVHKPSTTVTPPSPDGHASHGVAVHTHRNHLVSRVCVSLAIMACLLWTRAVSCAA